MFSHTTPEVKARALAAYPTYPHRFAAADLGGDITFWSPRYSAHRVIAR